MHKEVVNPRVLVDNLCAYLYSSECIQKDTVMRYTVGMRPRVEMSESVIEAREAIAGMELELTACDIDVWFEAHPAASPTMFALDFGIDPSALKDEAASNDLVRLAMYRIIALAESKLYTHVYGPKAVIQRVELFLPIETVSDNDFSDMFESNAG